MSKLKAKELKELSVDELTDKYEALKKELFNLRFQVKLQKLTNVSRIGETKRDIARVLTVKNALLRKS